MTQDGWSGKNSIHDDFVLVTDQMRFISDDTGKLRERTNAISIKALIQFLNENFLSKKK